MYQADENVLILNTIYQIIRFVKYFSGSGRGCIYFIEDASHKIDPFRACSDSLGKLRRKDGDVFQRRYFYVGYRHGVRIYEPYNIVSNIPETNVQQRLIWQENRADFVAARSNHRRILEDHYQYIALFA